MAQWGPDGPKQVSGEVRGIDDLAVELNADEINSRIAIGLWGPSKIGKTRAIIEAACHEVFQPCYILDTEFNVEKPFKQISKERKAAGLSMPEVKVIYCKVSTRGDIADDAIASIANFEDTLFALSDMEGGMLAVDSGTDLWQWLTLRLRKEIMNVEPSARIAPADYSWANTYYKKLMIMTRAIDSHMVVTAHSAEVFKDARLTSTGVYRAVWQKETPYYVDTEVRMDFSSDAKRQETPPVYNVATVKGSRELPWYNKKMENFNIHELYKELEPHL